MNIIKTLCLSTCIFSSHLLASDTMPTSNGVYIVPSVAYHLLDNKGNIDDLSSIGLNIGYQLSEHWALELGYRIGSSESRFGDDADMDIWQVDGLYNFSEMGSWQPYIVASASELSFEVDKTRNENQGGLGVGTYYRLSDRIRLRGDIRGLYSFTNDLFDSAFTLGVQVSFGKSSSRIATQASVPPPTLTPTPTPVVPHLYTFEAHFDSDSVAILSEYKKHVADLIIVLNDNPESRIVIEGDTDSTGSNITNLILSEERAGAVKAMLVKEHGIDANRIEIDAEGENNPIADNSTAEGRAENRRAVVKVRVIHE